MANRHLARSVVLQALFERDASNGAMSAGDAEARLAEYAKEFGARNSDMPFMTELFATAVAKQKEIDEVIMKAAPEWPIEKIAAIDRNILRLGLTELLYADRGQVPAKVAINEAIELAKTFGSASSGRFVNGVLGAVYIELGEPGKTDGGPRKQEGAGANKKMPVEELIGAVVFAREKGEVYLALVHDIFGHWTLSKGRLQENESHEDGVKRKVTEEIGLEVTVGEKLGENEYTANDTEAGGKKRRHATYFLAEAAFRDLELKRAGGLDDAQWFPLAAVGDLNFYDDILPVVTRAINVLAKKSKS